MGENLVERGKGGRATSLLPLLPNWRENIFVKEAHSDPLGTREGPHFEHCGGSSLGRSVSLRRPMVKVYV